MYCAGPYFNFQLCCHISQRKLQAIFIRHVAPLPLTPLVGFLNFLGWFFLASATVGLVFLYKCNTSDPGYIPRRVPIVFYLLSIIYCLLSVTHG